MYVQEMPQVATKLVIKPKGWGKEKEPDPGEWEKLRAKITGALKGPFNCPSFPLAQSGPQLET